MINHEELRELLRRVNLYNASKIETFDLGINDPTQYLFFILDYELKKRNENKVRENKKRSKLPLIKKAPILQGIDEWNLEELKKLTFIETDQNVLITGKCGVGKTALAVMIGNLALEKGYKVYYIKCDELIYVFSTQSTLSKSKKIYEYLKDSDLIIIDEVMYLPIKDEDLTILYKGLSFLSESRNLMCITNRNLSDWNIVAKDKHMMQTLIDRILKYAKLLNLN